MIPVLSAHGMILTGALLALGELLWIGGDSRKSPSKWFRGGAALCCCGGIALASLASSWVEFVIWGELGSLALAFLLGLSSPRSGGIYCYAQLGAGALVLLAASLSSSSGMGSALGPLRGASLCFGVLGLGIKAALPGLHFWLAPAYEEAPAEGLVLSGYASALGIFGLLRLVPGGSPLVLVLGMVMIFYGAFEAFLQKAPRRLLAFSSMSQLGFAVTALGTGTPEGRAGALVFALLHVLAKGTLFWVTALQERGGRQGIGKILLGGAFLLGGLTMAGCPGIPGYETKVLLKSGLQGVPLAKGVLGFGGIGTLLYLTALGHLLFSAPDKGKGRGFSPEGVSGFCSRGVLLLFGGALLGLSFAGKSVAFSWQNGAFFAGTLVAAEGIFRVFRRVWGDASVPDPEAFLLGRIPRLERALLEILRRFHPGKLRFSFLIFFGTLLGIFALFSWS